jgi:hypothetical protein
MIKKMDLLYIIYETVYLVYINLLIYCMLAFMLLNLPSGNA